MIDVSTAAGRVFLALVLLVVAAAVWRLARRGDGRARSAAALPDDVAADLLAAAGAERGSRATVVQISAPVCAACRQASRVWSSLADDGVAHVELNVEDHPGLATRLGLLRTPTSFVIDGDGHLLTRVLGAPSPRQARDAVAPSHAGAGT